MKTYCFLSLIFSLLISFSSGEQCGRQANGALCPNGLCCSEYGWCGYTEDYCKPPGCQSQCTPDVPPPAPSGDISDIMTRSLFEDMFKYRNSDICDAKGFYTYDAFITAAKSFPGFGTTGDTATRKKEIAAFFAQTAHQTTSGYPAAPGGPYAWGYCRKDSTALGEFCQWSDTWPCSYGKNYYGRGPIMLTWNYNYGQCGRDIGVDLLDNPDIVSEDSVISFKTAIWFWMTAQPPKPSCHAVISNQWQPSNSDLDDGRLPGYGLITNIISGGEACKRGQFPIYEDRIGFYLNFSSRLGVNPGDHLDCYDQKPFGSVELLLDATL